MNTQHPAPNSQPTVSERSVARAQPFSLPVCPTCLYAIYHAVLVMGMPRTEGTHYSSYTAFRVFVYSMMYSWL